VDLSDIALDEDWLRELATDMFPEDGRLDVYGFGEDEPSPTTTSNACSRSSRI
jgi:hypothetical protein